MNKSADAFRTIGEVADELVVPKHVLRFWEGKFPQIKPMKRGGGRRYYRPEDMELLRGIRHLLHAEGYTIKGVQKILREQGIDQVKTIARVAIEAAGARGAAKKAGLQKPVKASAPAQNDRVGAERAPARPIGANANERALRDSAPGAKGPAQTASKADVLKSAIRELEACRALLKGERAPRAAEPAKQVRAGGRT